MTIGNHKKLLFVENGFPRAPRPPQEYYSDERSMLELVFAPCSIAAGADRNWISGAAAAEYSTTPLYRGVNPGGPPPV